MWRSLILLGLIWMIYRNAKSPDSVNQMIDLNPRVTELYQRLLKILQRLREGNRRILPGIYQRTLDLRRELLNEIYSSSFRDHRDRDRPKRGNRRLRMYRTVENVTQDIIRELQKIQRLDGWHTQSEYIYDRHPQPRDLMRDSHERW